MASMMVKGSSGTKTDDSDFSKQRIMVYTLFVFRLLFVGVSSFFGNSV